MEKRTLTNACIEPLPAAELPNVQSLMAAVGWNIPLSRLQFYGRVGRWYGYREQNRLLATSAVFAWDDSALSIGNLVVRPDHQRQGIGRTLLTEILRAHPDATTLLVATAAGEKLYRNMGFQTSRTVVRLTRSALASGTPRAAVLTVDAAPAIAPANEFLRGLSLQRIVALDAKVYEFSREPLYRMLSQGENTFVVTDAASDQQHEITGFAIGVIEQSRLRIGPVIATTPHTASILVTRYATLWPGDIHLDVPADQTAFIEALKASQFREAMRSPLMQLPGSARIAAHKSLFAYTDAAVL